MHCLKPRGTLPRGRRRLAGRHCITCPGDGRHHRADRRSRDHGL